MVLLQERDVRALLLKCGAVFGTTVAVVSTFEHTTRHVRLVVVSLLDAIYYMFQNACIQENHVKS